MKLTEQDRRIAEEAWKNALGVFCRANASAAGADAAQHHAIAIILAAIVEAKKPLEEDKAALLETILAIRAVNVNEFGHVADDAIERLIASDRVVARAQCPTNQTVAPVASDKTDGEGKP